MRKYLYKDLYLEEDTHWWHIAKRKIILNLIQKYIPKKRLKIIDIGCGTGKNMEILSQFGETWGIDTSKDAIKYCKKRGLKNLVLGSAENINLPKNTFDLATLLDVLEHTDDEKLLNEINNILKSKGYIIITVPALQWMWSQWDVVLHHKRRYTKKSLCSILQRNNLKVIHVSYMYSFLVMPALLVRTIKQLLRKKDYGSDFSLSNSLLNTILGTFALVERLLVRRGLVPLGLSLIVLAQKKA